MRKLATAACSAIVLAGAVQAQEETTLRMATIAPSLSAAITMATFANVVTDNLDGVSIEVSGGGAATLHMMEVARGNLDMSMTNPVVWNLMANGRAMYSGEPDAPALSENLQLLMLYPYGQYHFAVRADSDIQVLDDLEGASVFLGPQGGGAFSAANAWVEATTGLVAGEDYEAITANWQTGFQAFLDGMIDVYVNGCLDPCGQFIQFTETEEIRFIGPESHEGEAVTEALGPFRFREEIAAGLYDGQRNETAVMSFNAVVGIGIRADLDEEIVYQITRAFWDNVDQITSDAPWVDALDVAFAPANIGRMTLHPGAARYYREVGVLD
ncbi:TAXI family TRAP transporter solute-binding subunit [Nioella aestuarii]|uniref:TAXI family TRAP transporter solute-binding subunit n=1 Tax=Nioella aestuarii TaxID=1662864 RepID=UPI003D7F874D